MSYCLVADAGVFGQQACVILRRLLFGDGNKKILAVAVNSAVIIGINCLACGLEGHGKAGVGVLGSVLKFKLGHCRRLLGDFLRDCGSFRCLHGIGGAQGNGYFLGNRTFGSAESIIAAGSQQQCRHYGRQ